TRLTQHIYLAKIISANPDDKTRTTHGDWSSKTHGKKLHQARKSQTDRGQTRHTLKIRTELAGPQGKAEEIWQMRMDPPFGFELQVLEGPSKGSKQTHTYVPMGDKTKVIVVGDFHRQGASDEEIRKGTLGYVEPEFK